MTGVGLRDLGCLCLGQCPDKRGSLSLQNSQRVAQTPPALLGTGASLCERSLGFLLEESLSSSSYSRALTEWEKSSEHPQNSLQHQWEFQHSAMEPSTSWKEMDWFDSLVFSAFLTWQGGISQRWGGYHIYMLWRYKETVANKCHKQRSQVWVLPNELLSLINKKLMHAFIEDKLRHDLQAQKLKKLHKRMWAKPC